MNGINDIINDIMNDNNDIINDINYNSHLGHSNYIGKAV